MSQRTVLFASSLLGLGLLAGTSIAPQDSVVGPMKDRADAGWSDGGFDVGALVVTVGDETLFTSATGHAPDSKRNASADTPLHGAPFAHTFLSSLAVRAAERGKLDLDDALGDLLPDLVGEDNQVHVEQLMNHTSGFVDCFAGDPLAGREGPSIWTGLRDVVRQPLETEPGSCVAPTTTNTLLLAAVIERVEDRPTARVIQSDLFDALGMQNSSCTPPKGAAVPSDASAGSEESGGDEPAAEFDPHWLLVSANDMARFQRALIDFELFGEDAYRDMTTPTDLDDGSRSPVGFGVQQIKVGGAIGVSAGRADEHGGALLRYFPEYDLTIAALATGGSGSLEDLSEDLALLVMDPPDRPLADIMLEAKEMKPYLGTYQIGCNSLILRAGEGRMILQMEPGGDVDLMYQGDHLFVVRDEPGRTLTFTVVDGVAESFVFDDHGVEAVARRFD